MLGIAVLAAAFAVSPRPAAAQDWIDYAEGRDGRVMLGLLGSGEDSDLFDRADGLRRPRSGTNPHALSETVTLKFDAERPMEMTLYTALVQNGKVVKEHRSEPFRVQPGRTITLGDQVIPERELLPALDGSSKASASEFIPGKEFLPAVQVGRRGGERQVIAIIASLAKVDWDRQQALYMVAVPSSADADVATRPAVILLDSAK